MSAPAPLKIEVKSVNKTYRIWNTPAARLRFAIKSGLANLSSSDSPWAVRLRQSAASDFVEVNALTDISFDLRSGETLGIIGRNGSGKSTLLQIVAGTLTPSSGSLAVNGRVGALLELGAGFNPDFTGRENIYLYGSILGLSRREISARMGEIERFADIGMFVDQPLKTYSTGMVVRVAFAVQSTIDPDVLIVDEALAVGDEAFQRKCMSRIDELKQRGTSILFVSHSAETVMQICDRAMMLERGRMICQGKPRDVVRFYQRFLYSRPEVQANMLANPAVESDHSAAPAAGRYNSQPPSEDSLEYFAEDLRTETHLNYDSYGATISNCRLLSSRGQPVNHLVKGRTYTFVYEVHFDRELEDVAFGMAITNTSGIEVGGVSTWGRRKLLRTFQQGQQVEVVFQFCCRIQQGTYFLRCGIGNERIGFIHRQVDLAMFKVIAPAEDLQTGLSDLSGAVRVQNSSDRSILIEEPAR